MHPAYPRIPYAQSGSPSNQALDLLRGEIRATIADLDWQNLTQLTLLVEKFGSHLSAGDPDIALIDLARSTAAIAAALAQQPPGEKLALIGGDLNGRSKIYLHHFFRRSAQISAGTQLLLGVSC